MKINIHNRESFLISGVIIKKINDLRYLLHTEEITICNKESSTLIGHFAYIDTVEKHEINEELSIDCVFFQAEWSLRGRNYILLKEIIEITEVKDGN